MKTCKKCGGTRFKLSGCCHDCSMNSQRRIRAEKKARQIAWLAANPVVKTCRKCGGVDFNPSGGCRPCIRITAATPSRRAAQKTLREKTKGRQKDYMAKWHVENKEYVAKKSAAYRAENKDRIRQLNRMYYLENKAEYIQRACEWKKVNPEKYAAIHRATHARNKCHHNKTTKIWKENNQHKVTVYSQNRRAKKLAVTTNVSTDIIEKLQKFQRGLCACCGEPLIGRAHLDHIVPLARGGIHGDSNLQLLLERCNLTKAAKLPVAFMKVSRAAYAKQWAVNLLEWRQVCKSREVSLTTS